MLWYQECLHHRRQSGQRIATRVHLRVRQRMIQSQMPSQKLVDLFEPKKSKTGQTAMRGVEHGAAKVRPPEQVRSGVDDASNVDHEESPSPESQGEGLNAMKVNGRDTKVDQKDPRQVWLL